MIKLGKVSQNNLETCHPKLRQLVTELARRIPKALDFSVTCGHRGEREQNEALESGWSTKAWPDSLHNKEPSLAVDLAPYPVDWKDRAQFARLAGYVQAVADDLGIKIRWGGDWDQDGRTADERFVDMPHFELAKEEW